MNEQIDIGSTHTRHSWASSRMRRWGIPCDFLHSAHPPIIIIVNVALYWRKKHPQKFIMKPLVYQTTRTDQGIPELTGIPGVRAVLQFLRCSSWSFLNNCYCISAFLEVWVQYILMYIPRPNKNTSLPLTQYTFEKYLCQKYFFNISRRKTLVKTTLLNQGRVENSQIWHIQMG